MEVGGCGRRWLWREVVVEGGGCGGRWLWKEVVVEGGGCGGRWLWKEVVVEGGGCGGRWLWREDGEADEAGDARKAVIVACFLRSTDRAVFAEETGEMFIQKTWKEFKGARRLFVGVSADTFILWNSGQCSWMQ